MRLKFKPNVGASRDSRQAGSSSSSVATGRGRKAASSKLPDSGGLATGSGAGAREDSHRSEGEESVPSNSKEQQSLSEVGKIPPGADSSNVESSRGTGEREQPAGGESTSGGNDRESYALTEQETVGEGEETVGAKNRFGTEAEHPGYPSSPAGGNPNVGEPQTVDVASQVDKSTVPPPLLKRSAAALSQDQSGVGRASVDRITRKRVAPNLVAARGKRSLRSSEGKELSEVAVKSVSRTPLRETGGPCSGEKDGGPAVGQQPQKSDTEVNMQPSTQPNDKSESHTESSTRQTTKIFHEKSDTPTASITPRATRSALNRTLCSSAVGLTTPSVLALPDHGENTDEMISDTLNEVLEHTHSSEEFASTGSDNLSGIVRSSLDLLCPPPPLDHPDVGGMELGDDSLRSGDEEELGGVSDDRDTSRGGGDSDIDGCGGGGGHDEGGMEDRDSCCGQPPSVEALTNSQPGSQTMIPRTTSQTDQGSDAGTSMGPSMQSSETSTQNASESTEERRTRAKRKASPPSTAEGPDAKRNFRDAPDKSTMTMRELIYYNPSANPMGSSVEEKKRKRLEKERAERAEVQHFFPQGRRRAAQQSDPPEKEEEGRIVPQLRIGADGNIIVDERSMVVETTPVPSTVNGSEPVLEHSRHTTSASFRKRCKVPRWSKEETTVFYKALSQVGTDFTMMTLLLPKRSRNELKNKFKTEEKKNPQRITEALENQVC